MAIQNSTRSSFLRTVSDFINSNGKHLCMLFSFFALIIGLFFAHKLWVGHREKAAQYDFSILMTEYETLLRDKDAQWSELLEKFEKNYAKHSSSSLLPYYLGYKVQILLHQNRKDEALATLDTMITNLVGSPLLALYEMERALIQLDSDNGELQNAGLKTLQSLATDTDNMHRDSAQYYLGSYYWAHNEVDKAHEMWKQLVSEQRDEKLAPSPWVQQVQQQLSLTAV
ncbi:MAG TPA: hypothetical protein VKU36_03725 [Candidatus Babeliales bacterium]|nr:hypothetical protein [Candidatus Babeliales bacterium]